MQYFPLTPEPLILCKPSVKMLEETSYFTTPSCKQCIKTGVVRQVSLKGISPHPKFTFKHQPNNTNPFTSLIDVCHYFSYDN